MGAVKLELRCPQSIGGVVIDPQPDWSFETLLSEISSIEKKLNVSSNLPSPFTKSKSGEVSSAKFVQRKTFVMRVDEMEDAEEDSEEAASGQQAVAGRRFACDEFYVSDSYDSEDGSLNGAQYHLMDKVGLVEGALSELTHEHQLSFMEEIRSRILALEANLMTDYKKFTTALSQVKRNSKTRREMDRKLDMQYQRRIAEALDNHLTAIQRDHEHKSQIEERRIRDDAAVEEAKRREKALQEEKLRQEKARAEAEMQARLEAEKKRAEEAKAAALEADRKAAKEAAEKVAKGDSARVATAAVSPTEAMGLQTGTSSGIPNDQSDKSVSNGVIKAQQSGNILKGAESALKLEERRLQIYKEVAVKNEALGFGSSSNLLSYGSKIQRLIKQISGTKENVRNKADQLAKIFSDSSCPQSITIAMFADKMVDQCVNPNKVVFAYAHVIVLVASQVPLAMDLLLAKLNRVCIYSVPKYITYSKSAYDTKEAYYKAIGYKEEDGEIETEDSYVSRIESYMQLYGALVQTEGNQNPHDLKQGWAWLARFLNALPANLYTAVALHAFLEMAGFALYRRYKSQFKKLLNLIHRDFVNALKERGGDAKLNKVITSIQTYIELKKFLEEPEGRSLQSSLLSHTFVPESEYSQSSYHRPINRFTYQY